MAADYYDVRLAKLDSWSGQHPPRYPDRFVKSHTCLALKDLPDGASGISCAGRIIALREMGKITFAHLQDHSGRIQIAFNARNLEDYKAILKHIDVGDYIGIQGEMFTTKRGERTLNITHFTLLAKALRSLPEKWHGLTDPDLRARQRYLDLISNRETWEKFVVRGRIYKFIREYLESHGFFEVETPVLQIASSGASARPFITHHNTLNIPLYLRIAPETYLKRLMVGGYERIYEIAKCFRNEGIDPSHLQEFTMLEYYVAYWNYRDNMDFTRKMIQEMVKYVTGSETIRYQGITLDFSGDWPEITYRDLIYKDTGIDLNQIKTRDRLKEEINAKGIDLETEKYIGFAALIDAVYKKCSRPGLIRPTFVTGHPRELVPLARQSDQDSSKLDMFQLIVNSWEIVKAYSELVNPVEQRERLMAQRTLAEAGDDEAMMLEEDYILCMEYGMPPMSGLGLGIDRMVALLTDSKNIRDIIYFPSLRPIDSSEIEEGEE
jgi:lysyl-tRNA synthetase class 2